ncbi:MAG: undecaprenyl-diphosphate phosphatase [Bacteroidota bacterium]|nr:undecaprenyl-diphosphate phosphatase [Bacteroidota bacterium]
MTYLQAIILAIVEGLTEFLPVSSTGHMIIVASLLGINTLEITKIFNVNIQFGAILAVVVLYRHKFFNVSNLNFYLKLFVAFVPAAVFGFILNDYIDQMLENVLIVAASLVLGGIVLIFIDKLFKDPLYHEEQEITFLSSFMIGFFQCMAMIPGISRSAATIIGGMSQKLSRKLAAEFSFFLAVPTMFAASLYKLYKGYHLINAEDVEVLVIGNVVAFLVGIVAIKFFISILTKYGFKAFGYYRIILGVIILLLVFAGIDLRI